MWDYLADGSIDCITSDHCSWSKSSKDAGYSSIWEAPNGLTGVQTLLPVVASEARRRGFSWEKIAMWTSGSPAHLWHLDSVKGSLTPGKDADLVFIDPHREYVLKSEDILHTEHWSPFIGKTLAGRVVRTMVRGATVFWEEALEQILVEPGYGHFVEV